MKKFNKKGFVLLETLVVSVFIISTLVVLYVQFVNLKKGYDTSFKYDSVSNLYGLKQVDNFINKQYGYGDLKDDLKNSSLHYIELFKDRCEIQYFSNNYSYCNKLLNYLDIKTLLIIDNKLDVIKQNFKENNPYSNGLYNYLKTIDPVLASKSYLLVAEYNDGTYASIKLDDVNVVVTFDANGGTVKEKTKNVTPGQPYGTLPTPTRDGYTFKGWNGKNMFNNNSIIYNRHVTIQNNKFLFDASLVEGNVGTSVKNQKYNNDSYVSEIYGSIDSGLKSFTITKDDSFNRLSLRINTNKDDPVILINLVNLFKNSKKYTISYNIESFEKNKAKATISNVQIEEGEVATPYEPYYITSDTKVVQEDDHTLTAIWEKN